MNFELFKELVRSFTPESLITEFRSSTELINNLPMSYTAKTHYNAGQITFYYSRKLNRFEFYKGWGKLALNLKSFSIAGGWLVVDFAHPDSIKECQNFILAWQNKCSKNATF